MNIVNKLLPLQFRKKHKWKVQPILKGTQC